MSAFSGCVSAMELSCPCECVVGDEIKISHSYYGFKDYYMIMNMFYKC
jgi:hypothetical protein